MDNILRKSIIILIISTSLIVAQSKNDDNLLQLLNHPENSQGSMAGLVNDTSVLLQTRLTLTNFKIANDYIGCEGWGRFIILGENRDTLIITPWKNTVGENDYIIKIFVDNLESNTTYF